MNFSGVSDKSLAGRFLRLPLRLIPPDTVVPILQGRLKGLRWIVGSSNHGCWLGSYEYDKRVAFEEAVRDGDVVLDIGANVGFYTLLASVLVGPCGRVVAFEPVPSNVRLLQAHLRLNRIINVQIVEAAVCDCAGVASFDESNNNAVGHLSAVGSLRVKTVTLDELVAVGEVPAPTCIKIDVEGAEARVLAGGRSVLSTFHPSIFLATHGREAHRECCERLRSLGYELKPIGKRSLEESDEIVAFGRRDAHP